MSDLPKPETVPQNEEHFEAYQAEINRVREEQKAQMSPQGRAKMEAIEQAVSILEKAGVQFQMYAGLGGESRPEAGVWDFNKWSYEADFEKRGDEGSKFFSAAANVFFRVFTRGRLGIAVYLQGTPVAVYAGGEQTWP